MPDEVAPRLGWDGTRWINQRPTPEEVATWLRESLQVDPALNADDYIGGIVVIPAVDSKVPYVTGFRNGVPVIDRREELTFTPYARVETRIKYLWDMMAAHPEWKAVVTRVTPPRPPADPVMGALEAILACEREQPDSAITAAFQALAQRPAGALAQMVNQLPEGFSITSVPVGENYTHFLCATTRVAIYDARDWRDATPEERATLAPLREGIGTKQIPLLRRGWNNSVQPDENVLMKAETGAFGRALGFAGIFVVSGIATAEDMAEAAAQGQPVVEAAPTPPQAPPEPAGPRTSVELSADTEARLRERAATLWKSLSEQHPDKTPEFHAWAKERKLANLSDAQGPVLIGVVKKLQKLVDEAQEAEGTGDGPAAETAAESSPDAG